MIASAIALLLTKTMVLHSKEGDFTSAVEQDRARRIAEATAKLREAMAATDPGTSLSRTDVIERASGVRDLSPEEFETLKIYRRAFGDLMVSDVFAYSEQRDHTLLVIPGPNFDQPPTEPSP